MVSQNANQVLFTFLKGVSFVGYTSKVIATFSLFKSVFKSAQNPSALDEIPLTFPKVTYDSITQCVLAEGISSKPGNTKPFRIKSKAGIPATFDDLKVKYAASHTPDSGDYLQNVLIRKNSALLSFENMIMM